LPLLLYSYLILNLNLILNKNKNEIKFCLFALVYVKATGPGSARLRSPRDYSELVARLGAQAIDKQML